MAVIQEISLDVKKVTQFAKFRIQQGNAIDMKVDVLITEDNDPYLIPDTAQVILRMLKKDGKPIFNTCDKLGENKVQFTITPEISALDGRCPAKLQIIDSATGGDLRTIEFHMLIDKDVYSDSLITSTGEYTALQDALLRVGDVSSIVTNAENATADAIEATQNAIDATDSINQTNTEVQNAEDIRIANENTRISSEDSRVLAETDRESNETTRESNENTREANELDRENSEQTRETNETERQDFYNAYKVCEPYNSSKQYVVGNKVTYGGSTYQCILDCSGIAPTNTTNWLLIASKGADGTGGDMMASVYDPTGKANDAYDSANHSYSNTSSNLSSTTTQSAIDELDSIIGDKSLLQTESNTDLVVAINEVNAKPEIYSGYAYPTQEVIDSMEIGDIFVKYGAGNQLFENDEYTTFLANFNDVSGNTVTDLKGNNGSAIGTVIVQGVHDKARQFRDKASGLLSNAYVSYSSTITLNNIIGNFEVGDLLTFSNPSNSGAGKYSASIITEINGNTFTLNPSMATNFDIGTQVWTSEDKITFPPKGTMISGVGSFTIEMLVTINKANRYQYLFSRDGVSNNKRRFLSIVWTVDNKFGSGISELATNTSNHVWGTTVRNVNQQYYLTVVRDVENMKSLLYVDGVLEIESAFTSVADLSDINNELPYLVGRDSYGDNYRASAIYDEIRISNKARTLVEIQATQAKRP